MKIMTDVAYGVGQCPVPNIYRRVLIAVVYAAAFLVRPMPITPEVKRHAQYAPGLARQLAGIADQAARIVQSYNANGVSADLSDVTAETNVTGNTDRIVTKQELVDAITLLASIAYYLQALTGSLPTLTALETPPLSPADLRAYLDKLSYV
ncbi:MAG: hypothetical protein KatS3mg051_1719 [Anaerolineae bacterium]|nr:MAG: hypothetical protein KatS3mg051_1719 [Anaerolineae bacterium]